MKYLLGAGLLALVLSLPGVNFYHHLSLPKIDKFVIYETKVDTVKAFLGLPYKVNVYLTEEIVDPPKYYDIVNLVLTSASNATIEFHLIGYGGQADSTTMLIDAIRRS